MSVTGGFNKNGGKTGRVPVIKGGLLKKNKNPPLRVPPKKLPYSMFDCVFLENSFNVILLYIYDILIKFF